MPRLCNVATCSSRAEGEWYDVVTGEWFPVCDKHLEVMKRLGQQSDRIAPGMPGVRHVPSSERFRKLS